MDVNDILAKLQKVKGRNGAWSACCPAHEDRGPSLSVKELPDGRILMHCFAGCGTDAILGVLGMEMGDLFPESLDIRMPPTRGFTAADALRGLVHEGTVVAIAAADLVEGKQPTQASVDRVLDALGRINMALEFTLGS
jgi:hypothetical protein